MSKKIKIKEKNLTTHERYTRYESNSRLSAIMVFTVSADEYCNNVGKELKDYVLVGLPDMQQYKRCYDSRRVRAFYVPEGTEAVVDYRRSDVASGAGYYSHYERSIHSGTALIPRDFKPKPVPAIKVKKRKLRVIKKADKGIGKPKESRGIDWFEEAQKQIA